MKNTFLLIILTAALVTEGFSQTGTKYFDSRWKPTEERYAEYYRPEPKKEGNYYRVLDYYKSGKLQGSALSSSPDKEAWEGTMVGFFETGDTMFTAKYKNGVLNGTSTEYQYPGQKQGIINFKNGKRHGYYVQYFPDGRVGEQGYYNEDEPDSTWKVYNYEGLIREYNFSKGKLHGKYFRKTVDEEEQHTLTFKGSFKNGEVVDYAMYVDNEKKPRTTAKNINGTEEWKLRVGDTVLAVCYFRNHKRTGEWKNYSHDGKAVAETITYFSDSCNDQQPVEITKKDNDWIILPQRFSGLFDINTDCTTGRRKKFDTNGRVIYDNIFTRGEDSILTDIDVPYNQCYSKLTKYYDFYSERGYYAHNPEDEVYITTVTEAVSDEAAVIEEPTVAEAPVVEEPRVFTFVEQMPQFPGGDAALMQYIQKNIVYPAKALADSIEGKVFVRFTVRETGVIEDVTIMRSLQADIDKEAVRVVKSLPPFKPGRQQGKPVAVYFTLPIVFKLW